MPETSVSLLERLRLCPDEGSWQRLVRLYTPWIGDWLRHHGLGAADAEDVVQDVMAVLVQELPNFRHDLRRGAFRRWLRSVTLNRLRVFWRRRPPAGTAEASLSQLEDENSDLSRLWEREHDRHVVRRLLELLEGDFEPSTWQAFRLLMFEGRTTAETAAQLGLSPVAVRLAKSRVLRRFRQEIAGLLD